MDWGHSGIQGQEGSTAEVLRRSSSSTSRWGTSTRWDPSGPSPKVAGDRPWRRPAVDRRMLPSEAGSRAAVEVVGDAVEGDTGIRRRHLRRRRQTQDGFQGRRGRSCPEEAVPARDR